MAVSHAAEDYLARRSGSLICRNFTDWLLSGDLGPASCGVVAPVTKMKIIDPETEKELPTGESGEICLYGINICTGYYKDKKATKAAFTKDGWFKSSAFSLGIKGVVANINLDSGDIGYISEEKFLCMSKRLAYRLAIPDLFVACRHF